MKKLLLLLLTLITINAHASFSVLKHENSKLIDGSWNYYKMPNKQIAVGVEIKIQTTGWEIDSDWKMLKFSYSYNGETIEIDPHYLNEDDNPYTYFKVEPSGPNSAYISFRDVWFTNDIESVKKSITTYTITGIKNKKDHNCVILVNYGDFPTSINEIYVQSNDTIYDLQGRVLKEKPLGPYIQNHCLKIGK